MPMTFFVYRLASVLAVTTMLGIGIPASARAAAFPPLNHPATQEQHPGKFVWADLFTTDPEAATKFYTAANDIRLTAHTGDLASGKVTVRVCMVKFGV